MNWCGYQQIAMPPCGETRGTVISLSDPVVCPKPRRIGIWNPSMNDRISPRWHANSSHQTEFTDCKAGTELLDIILAKGICSAEKSNIQVASSPPFFCGSPPSRASNPLILDSGFGKNELNPLPEPIPATSPSFARTIGSCARISSGHKTPLVRVEGFDCLSRDRQSISAVA